MVNEESLLAKMESKIKKQLVQLEKELKTVNENIKSIEKQKTKLIQLLISEIITQEDYRKGVKQNEENLKSLVQSKAGIEKKLVNLNNPEQIKELKKELEQFAKIDVLTPEILHRLIEKIEIKADGTARVFSDSRYHLLIFIVILATRSTPHAESVCGNTRALVGLLHS